VFFGDYERAFSLPDELGAITAEGVRDVAAAVFNTNRMTVGVLQSPDEETQK